MEAFRMQKLSGNETYPDSSSIEDRVGPGPKLLPYSKHNHAPSAKNPSRYVGLDTYLKSPTQEEVDAIKREHPHVPELTDPWAVRMEYMIRLPRSVEDWAVKHVVLDPRDTMMLSVIANICLTTWPLGILLCNYPSHLLGILYFVFNSALWLPRFILLMHYAEHRSLFKKKLGFARRFLPWVLAPFFGIPPGTYHGHHVVMHHTDNNIAGEDLSSTEAYQRDSIPDFLHYYGHYLICLALMPLYALRKKRNALFLEIAAGVCTWFGVIGYMFSTGNGLAATYLFLVPYFMSSIALMFGNWSQHIFVRPDIASIPMGEVFKYNNGLTMTCMNTLDNQVTFNDGYHTTHHARPRTHWTEMPQVFMSNVNNYAKHDAVVFKNTFFHVVGFMCFYARYWDEEKGYRWLYDHFVHFGKKKRTYEEVKAFLKSRLPPIKGR